MASRALMVVAVLALACQMAAADTLSVWSYKKLPTQRVGLTEEVRSVVARVAAAQPEVLLYIDSDVSIDTQIKNIVKTELGSRAYDAYIPFSPSNRGLEAQFAKAMDAKTVVVANFADLSALSIDGPTVVFFTASPKLLTFVIEAVKKSTDAVTYVYSVRGLGYIDIINDNDRVARGRDVAEPIDPTDPTYINSMHFALTLESLFETYTIFSPATFMGLLAIIVLLITTFIGFSCLMSLQTPSHFEKKHE